MLKHIPPVPYGNAVEYTLIASGLSDCLNSLAQPKNVAHVRTLQPAPVLRCVRVFLGVTAVMPI